VAQRQPLADIQFIADFAAFCRSKGDETYNSIDSDVCALAQFGYPRVSDDNNGRLNDPRVPERAYEAVFHQGTFSALADRLEALIADAPVVERVS
jgi:hypothetical protein